METLNLNNNPILNITTYVDEYRFPMPAAQIPSPVLIQENEGEDREITLTYSLRGLTPEDLQFYWERYLLPDFINRVIKSSGDDDYYDYLPDYADMVSQFIQQTGIITEDAWNTLKDTLAHLCEISGLLGYDGLTPDSL